VLLVTGFEPFGGLERNPSGEIARILGGEEGVHGAVLPVDYRRIDDALAELLAEPWDAVVLLGVAVGRAHLSLEKVAINFRDPDRPDNAGYRPDPPEVVPGGPDAYFSTLPLEAMRDRLRDEGVPAAVSLTAGAYLCNASMYLARHRLGGKPPCGFIHLPPTPDLVCGAPPLDLETQLRGLRCVISTFS